MDVSLSLLGPPLFQHRGSPLLVRPLRAQALLWYVGAHAGQGFTRHHLACLLWEDADDGERRNRFNTLLSRLRDVLPVWPFTEDGGMLALAPEVSVDVARFRRLLAEGDAGGLGWRAELAEAVTIWRGPFLQGFDAAPSATYDEWLLHERESWEVQVLAACERLVALDEAEGAWADLARHAEQALLIDPLQERFHRARMRALYEEGDRAAALAQYETCRALLERELGVLPHPSTTELAILLAAPSPPTVFAAPPRSGPQPQSANQPPFVGREEMLRASCHALLQAGQGEGGAVLVTGVAGMGKSRMLAEIAGALSRTGGSAGSFALVLTSQCHEGMALPYAPLAPILTAALAHVDLSQRQDEPWLAEAARLIPELRLRLPDALWLGTSSAPARAEALYLALTRFLALLPRPLLVVLDDLHWADEASLSFLSFLMHAPQRRGLALLMSARPEDLSSHAAQFLARLAAERLLTRHELPALRIEDIAVLSAALLKKRRDPGLAERIHLVTGGNPFLVVELLRGIEEAGPPSSGSDLPLPATVQAMVQQRLARLSEAATALLDAVAVFGTPVPLDIARQVARLDEDGALGALDALLAAHILVEEEAAEAELPGVAIGFAHELIRRVVLGRLSVARRASLHRRAYMVLLRLAKEPEVQPYLAERLALHAEAAQLWEEHSRWALVAANAAEQVAAHRAACCHLEAALRSLERLPSTRSRRLQSVDIRLRLALLGWTSTPERSASLVEAVDREVAGKAVEASQPYLELMARQVERLMLRGHLDQAGALVLRLLPLAKVARRRPLMATGLLLVAQLRALAGDLVGSVDPFEESRRLFDQLGDAFGYAQAAGTLGSVLATMGEFARADAVLTELDRRADALRHPLVRILAHLHRLTYHVLAEEWTEAVTSGQRVLRLLQDDEYRPYEYMTLVFLALPLARLGDLAGGVALAEQAVAMAPRLGLRILQDRAYAYLAGLLLAAGRVTEAKQAASEGLAVARQDGYRYGVAFNTRLLGEVAAARHDRAEARRLIVEARDAFAAMAAAPDARHCADLLARIPGCSGRTM